MQGIVVLCLWINSNRLREVTIFCRLKLENVHADVRVNGFPNSLTILHVGEMMRAVGPPHCTGSDGGRLKPVLERQ